MHIVAEDEVPGFVFQVYSIVKASALRNRSGCSAGFLDLWSGTYIPQYNAIHDCAVALFQIYIRFSPPKRLDLRSSQAIIHLPTPFPKEVGLSDCRIVLSVRIGPSYVTLELTSSVSELDPKCGCMMRYRRRPFRSS